jgi:hypothetical protein
MISCAAVGRSGWSWPSVSLTELAELKEMTLPPNALSPDDFSYFNSVLAARGLLFSTAFMQFFPGKPGECHLNTYLLYILKRGKIATGYGRVGRTWDHHSWGWNGNSIIETTFEREEYFGVVLLGSEVARFLLSYADHPHS